MLLNMFVLHVIHFFSCRLKDFNIDCLVNVYHVLVVWGKTCRLRQHCEQRQLGGLD